MHIFADYSDPMYEPGVPGSGSKPSVASGLRSLPRPTKTDMFVGSYSSKPEYGIYGDPAKK